MLINRVYKFFDLMEVVKYYINKMGCCISFEYGLFGGVNDQVEYVEEFVDLLEGIKCYVNLILVNYVFEWDYVCILCD